MGFPFTQPQDRPINKNIIMPSPAMDIDIDEDEGEVYIESIDMEFNLDTLKFEELLYGFEFTVLEYGTEDPVEGADITITSSDEIGEQETKTEKTDSNGDVQILDILNQTEYGTLEYDHHEYYSNIEYMNVNFDRIRAVGEDLIIESTLYMQPLTEDLPGISNEINELSITFEDIEWEEII